MSASKLSDAEKQEIIKTYQAVPAETTITLADQYGVSSSTIRRVLQGAISKEIYDSLTQQKQRLHRTVKRSPEENEPIESFDNDANSADSSDLNQPEESSKSNKNDEPFLVDRDEDRDTEPRRRRRRSSAPEGTDHSDEDFSDQPTSTPKLTLDPPAELTSEPLPEPRRQVTPLTSRNRTKDFSEPESYSTDAAQIPDFIDEEFNEAFGEFEEDDEEDEEDYLEDFEEEDDSFPPEKFPGPSNDILKILPLTDASLPRMCYLVTDRLGELVVRPLKAFGELGKIPPEEVQEKTLPVFDNHRVASRFSARNQRVLKIPDAKLLKKTAPHLQAKGITRLLIDGQVYKL
ncbi:MAG: transcriptional regulator [Oscillatoriales cyanobacterium RM1_1_9]|nr:transcriptional regulator [Oscillatoriales cyanobacterium SM2_3_0]NJO45989.1 transcriptional regulator [Oscillatoriales cyanobacterium RM2_1_1]NJO70563.1 transcriptional regulator [Oscillatoriales cyanobacterium RM1_1_9]